MFSHVRGWIALGVILRAVALVRARLYFDEGNVLCLMREPWPDLIDTLRQNVVYPPGSFAALRFTGGDEWAVRLSAFVIGLVTIFLFDRLARELLEPPAACAATALWCISPMAIELSVEAKMYGLELVALVAGSLAWVRLAAGGRGLAAAGVAAGFALAVSFQYLAALGGVALGLTALLSPGLPARRRAALLAALWLAALVQLPWLLHIADHAQGPGSHIDIPGYLAGVQPSLPQAAKILVGLSSHNLPAIPGLGLRTVGTLTCLWLACGWVTLWRREGGGARLAFLVPAVVVPVVVAAVVAPTYPGYGNVAKYAVAALPALVLTVAAGLSGPGWPARAHTGLFLVVTVLSLHHTFCEVLVRETWHEAARALRAISEGPVVVWPATSLTPLCASDPGFLPSSPRLRILPKRQYGRPVTRSREGNLFLSLSWSLEIDADAELAATDLDGPPVVVMGRPPDTHPIARRILDRLAERFGPPVALVDRGKIPVVYRFGAAGSAGVKP